MKRFLLSSLLVLVAGQGAFAYVNDSVVQVPTMNPELIQLDTPDGIFVNNGTFNVSIPQLLGGSTILYETSSTRNYTNNGTMTGSPGFDFENFPASVGKATNAESFVNFADGFGGGTITAINTFGGLNIFQQGGILVGAPPTADLAGLAMVRVRATNVVDNGLITMDSTGLIDIVGKEVNLDRGRFLMTGGGGVNFLDWGGGGFATNSGGWAPAFDFSPTTAISPIFTNFQGVIEQMTLFNATAYFQDLDPQPGPDNVIIWRIIFLQDSSPTNVSASVFFGNAGIGGGAFHVQWTGTYRDPFTGGTATTYFTLSDVPENRRGPFFFNPPTVPADFSFAQGATPPIIGTPATPGFNAAAFLPVGITNDFTYINAQPTALSVGTNQITGGSPTNLPGRVQFTSSGSLNLANVHISGDNYLSINAPVNYLGNSNSMITAPWASLNLGVTNGSLTVSNLLSPELPGWTGADFAPSAVFGIAPNGGIQAFSGSYFFVTTNLVGTNSVAVTNDVRILMVNSALQPTLPALQKDVRFHAPQNLVISDHLNVNNSFYSDTTTLTITTNANSAYSLKGDLNLGSQDIFLSASLPNLQFFTNSGAMTTRNLTDFAGGLASPFSPRSGATPIQTFANFGMMTNQGLFVFANTVVNSGQIFENINGNIDIQSAGSVIQTNGGMFATNGSMSIVAHSLFLSNSVINVGRSLTLTAPCSISDGYVLSNMFGHATNVTLPNLVTNGNFFSVGGGLRTTVKPPTADLLGTTITNISMNSLDSINQLAGADRGATPSGYADNLAVGRMIFVSDGNPSRFTFRSLPGENNAIYIDSIELRGGATNTANNGDYTAFNIEPGMKVYYAQALQDGASIAEKLNGKNGGGFLWVSNYAGIFSSTNIPYADGNTYIFNEALVISPDINTDGEGQVNRDDPEPIPAGLTFDIPVLGPQQCVTNVPPPIVPPSGGGETRPPGVLPFPPHKTSDGGSTGVVSFVAAQGSYNGLFYETNGVNPAHSGFFSAKVTSKGNFSGKLQLGTKTYSVGKAFSPSGNYTSFVTGKGLATPLTVTLHLMNNDQIVGTVSSGTNWTAQLVAVIETSAAAIKDSLLLSADTNSSTTVSGDSFGTMSLSKNGEIKWSGVLPDGGTISQKSALSKGGVWPVYSSLYNGNGALIGWLRLTNNNSEVGGSAVWIVPPGSKSLCPNGVTNNLNATGSSVNNPRVLSDSTIVLSGPHLASPLTNHVIISGKSGKTGQSEDKSLTLSVDIKNGLFSGSVVDPNNGGQKLSFQGALVEKSGTGGGFFLNASKDQGGKVSLAAPAN